MDDHRHAVVLAGGRGTRFWPHSRAARPKQLLAPFGGPSLLRRTVDRLQGVVGSERIWIVASETMLDAVRAELPELDPARIIGEPEQRNTAPAIGLVATLLLREDRDAVMGVFPADHHVAEESTYRDMVTRAFEAAQGDRLIVLGVTPTSPETGYGYIEFPSGTRPDSLDIAPVERFCEKPDLESARAFLASGRHFWNSGQFFWRVDVLAEEMARHLPRTWETLNGITGDGPDGLSAHLAERYARCEDISIDHAVLEKSERVAGFVVDTIGWTDLGSWEALYALLEKDRSGNCSRTDGVFVSASGNYVDVPGKLVALLGVDDLVVVETPDALLICPRTESQRVRTVIEVLQSSGRQDLL